jgi:hypothetical protein
MNVGFLIILSGIRISGSTSFLIIALGNSGLYISQILAAIIVLCLTIIYILYWFPFINTTLSPAILTNILIIR